MIHPELRAYYGVLVPWVPAEFQTEYHNPDTQGSWAFKPICRGSLHNTMASAITWARTHLQGTPYEVRLYADIGAAVMVGTFPGVGTTPWRQAPRQDNNAGLYLVIRSHDDGMRDLYRVTDEIRLTPQMVMALVESQKFDISLHLNHLTPAV